MLQRIASFIFLLLCSLPGFPQMADTAVVLPTVEVGADPLRKRLTGGRTEAWKKETLEIFQSSHLGDLLSQQSGVFIKSYGGGSSATSSIRGAGAGHSVVLWNGLPLQSPMLGQLDFSLLPVAFTDEVQLQHGGNTAAWGSGAIGGVISLENDAGDTTALSLRSTIGSFGFLEQQARAAYGKKAWKGSTRLFYQTAKNDFPYFPAPGLPEKRLSNAALRQGGALQEIYWQPALGQQFALRVWAQAADRQIPPTIVQNFSEATQNDAFLRTALHWKKLGKRVVWQARAGVFREKLDYRDELTGLGSLTRYWVATAEADAEWHLNDRQRLHFGLGHTWMQAEAKEYEKPQQQHRTAPFAAFLQRAGNWQFQVNLRQEVADGRLTPLAPSFGLEGQPLPWLTLQANASRNYRLPTFNDLYWQPGGNPGLLPETGWSQEITAAIKPKRTPFQWSYSLTGFNRHIKNWILWSPRDGQFFWSAGNIARVWSRGLEQRLNASFGAGNRAVQLSGGYDFILSTNEVAVDQPHIEAGEQLLYVPRHLAFGRLAFRWKNFNAAYQHRYTGPVSAVNVGTLPGYHLGFVYAAWAMRFKRWEGQLFLHLHNVWNADYQVVERRPMPGRWFQVGVEVKLIPGGSR